MGLKDLRVVIPKCQPRVTNLSPVNEVPVNEVPVDAMVANVQKRKAKTANVSSIPSKRPKPSKKTESASLLDQTGIQLRSRHVKKTNL